MTQPNHNDTDNDNGNSNGGNNEYDASFWVPGTIALEDLQHKEVILHPVPTSDPNDPLNWTDWRKQLNFAIVSFYVLITFVQLDIGFTAWEAYQDELGFSIDLLNAGSAVNYGGLAVGCIIFIPLVHKFGRRPMYIFSNLLQLISCIWFAITKTRGDFVGSNLLSGLGGAISETIVQMSIADLFFVHQHATMNGWYLFATFVGAYLGPVASGYIVETQGWRWTWWWCVIFLGVSLLLSIFAFDESKWVNPSHSSHHEVIEARRPDGVHETDGQNKDTLERLASDAKPSESADHVEWTRTEVNIDQSIPLKTYRQRMALITNTKTDFLADLYQPVIILFTFPAITFAALTFGSLLAWLALLTSVQATYLFEEPFNFSAAGVGLMNLAPFIGCIPAVFFGGYLNDKSIVWLSKRNGGIYEPEMRLWLALPMAIITPAGILMNGLGLAYGTSWVVVAVGYGFFGFGLTGAGDIALTYAMDCYHHIIGNALVGIVFTRNAIAVLVLFTITPWIDGMGLRNVHILACMICFAIMLLPIPLLLWGKKARAWRAEAYRKMALKQPTHRKI